MKAEVFFKVLSTSPVRKELKEKGSQFIALAFNVESLEEIEILLKKIKAQFHDATHRCYAYHLASGEYRTADDGEPAGSAGKPILAVINGAGLRNVIIVVVRYFGGTKLGVGGLIRAYGGVAKQCIEETKLEDRYPTVTMKISFAYNFVREIESILPGYIDKKLSEKFGEDVCFELVVKKENSKALKKRLNDISGGRVKIKYL